MARNVFLYLPYRVLTVEGITAAMYTPWLMLHRGVSTPTMAMLLALSDVTIFLCQVPTGWFADKVGRKPSLALGSLFQLAGMALFWWAASMAVIVAAFTAIAIGDAFRMGAQEALLYESCEDEAHFERFYAGSQAWLLGVLTFMTMAGGVLAQAWGYDAAWLAELLCSAAGLLLVPFFQETPRHAGEAHASLPWRTLIRLCPWGIVAACAVTMASANAAGLALKVSLLQVPPAAMGVVIGALPFVEMLGAALALRLPFGLRGLAAIATVGLAAVALTPLAALIPFLACGAAPALKVIAVNRAATDRLRASLDSLAQASELILEAVCQPLMGRALTAAQPLIAVPLLAAGLLATALLPWPGSKEDGAPLSTER